MIPEIKRTLELIKENPIISFIYAILNFFLFLILLIPIYGSLIFSILYPILLSSMAKSYKISEKPDIKSGIIISLVLFFLPSLISYLLTKKIEFAYYIGLSKFSIFKLFVLALGILKLTILLVLSLLIFYILFFFLAYPLYSSISKGKPEFKIVKSLELGGGITIILTLFFFLISFLILIPFVGQPLSILVIVFLPLTLSLYSLVFASQ